MIVFLASPHWPYTNFIISLLLLAGFGLLHHFLMVRTLIKRDSVSKYITAAAALLVVYMGIKIYQNYLTSPGHGFEQAHMEMAATMDSVPDAIIPHPVNPNTGMTNTPPHLHVLWEKAFMDFMIILLLVCVDITTTLLVLYKRREVVLRQAIEKKEAAKKGLYIRADRKLIRIMPKTISYIRGMNEYIRINFVTPDKEPILVHKTMKQCMAALPDEFVQVQKSYIVNMDHVKEVETARVILEDDTAIPIGESYRKGLNEHLNRNTPTKEATTPQEDSQPNP